MDLLKIVDNFKKIINEPYDHNKIKKLCDNGKGMAEFDLFILNQYLKYKNFKTITEFGCGTSTLFLRNNSYKVTSYALHDMSGKKTVFIKKNITDPNTKSEISNSINNSDLLLIDAHHSANFAKYYVDNFLEQIKKPIFIHDFFTTINVNHEEYKYLRREFIPKNIYEIFVFTDLPEKETNEISKIINYDLNIQRNYHGKRPPVCSVIMEPKDGNIDMVV